MKKTAEFKNQSIEELKALEIEARRELFELHNQKGATKKLEKPHQVQHMRKKIARILTILREKEEAK